MSKELTEKWKNGTLEIGWYFIRIKDGRCVKDYFKKDFEVFFDTYIEEVLAKVPTYDQFVELIEKIEKLEWRNEELEQQNAFECECNKEYADTLKKNEQLEKKLEIATKTLKKIIQTKRDFDDDPMNKIGFLAWGRLHDIEKISKQALKEIKEVKND